MTKFFTTIISFLIVTSCSNSPELDNSGEIKVFEAIIASLKQTKTPEVFIDAKYLISRKKIDDANTPVLYVKLESGQNGTLTPYPGQGIGQTWLGADGATVTMNDGVLMATRGLGEDLMGSITSKPPWNKINQRNASYQRETSFLSGENKKSNKKFNCRIKKSDETELIKIWNITFKVRKYKETCQSKNDMITNLYFVDDRQIVRRSKQYHSSSLGYIYTERLDR